MVRESGVGAWGRVERVVAAFGRGRFVVVTDDADREGEGDLMIAAGFLTAERMAFLLRNTSGIVCAAMGEQVADRLELAPMIAENEDPHRTAFTVTVDAARGVTTGISAHDRSATMRVLGDPRSGPGDLNRPGHVFPLRANPGGVLGRRGHTEAGVDLAALAGLPEVTAICELTNNDGSVCTLREAEEFARQHDLPVCSVADLVDYRNSLARGGARGGQPRSQIQPVVVVSEAVIPRSGVTTLVRVYRSADGEEHVAVVVGDPEGDDVLVRVHSECFTGDVLGSGRCDCGPQLIQALDRIGRHGRGVVVYLRGHEGRGIGLAAKLRAYVLQDQGFDTVDANVELGLPVDARSYESAAAILEHLGVRSVVLLTNNPAKVTGLEAGGINVIERSPLVIAPIPESRSYLETKRRRMGHLLPLPVPMASSRWDASAAEAARPWSD
jgi:3,4-dihydroxy 2-butanone 4-phosphate synthase/GTP cyclohydrolase II